jgi:hypothetical protein
MTLKSTLSLYNKFLITVAALSGSLSISCLALLNNCFTGDVSGAQSFIWKI